MTDLPVNSICVIGLGYIGLPTAIIFASHGVQVTGVDISDRHVDAVNRGELPFVEEGLDVVLADVVGKGLLKAQKDTPEADYAEAMLVNARTLADALEG